MDIMKEINALFSLIDDPDHEVFATVCDRISEQWGGLLIPHLEDLWENVPDPYVQNRIELLIHRLQFEKLYEDVDKWSSDSSADLLSGSLLVARYCFPDLSEIEVRDQIGQIMQDVWLELNDQMTRKEQFVVLKKVIFGIFKFKSNTEEIENVNNVFINKVLESKIGAPILIGIILQIIAKSFGIPLLLTPLMLDGQHALLALYSYDTDFFPVDSSEVDNEILCFVDTSNGAILDPEYTLGQLESFDAGVIKPLHSVQIVSSLFLQLATYFENGADQYRIEELIEISNLIIDKYK